MKFLYIIPAAVIVILGVYALVLLMIDAHVNGRDAHRGTERAGEVEVRE